jgi:type III secretory pathway lipoprotein EscJ
VVIVRNSSGQGRFGVLRRAWWCNLHLRGILSFYAILMCLGCDSGIELAQNVSQRQSLAIVSVLSKAGIEASAVGGKGSNGRFSIYVDKKN